jgi:integrase
MPTLKFTAESVEKLPAPVDVPQFYYWDERTTGFGLVVGRTGVKTFIAVARERDTGKKVKKAIGVLGQPRDEGSGVWTVQLARDAAERLIPEIRNGSVTRHSVAPSEDAPKGPTLRQGLQAHLSEMTKKKRSEASIHTFETELTKYMSAWLDRPIVELTALVLTDLHEKIKANVRPKKNANPMNAKGAPVANRVLAHISAAWNALDRLDVKGIGERNAAKRVTKDTLDPKRQRLTSLAEWVAKVATMKNPIQRDGLTFALYTGLRSEDVRTVRFEWVDWDAKTLRLPDPKGGASAAFTIPLAPLPFEILERRWNSNEAEFGIPDGGWAFPGVSADGSPGPIGDLRQQIKSKTEEGTKTRFPEEDVHTLRREWESIGQEEGISELDLHVLSNHSFGSRNVNSTYIAQHISHLAKCAEKIDRGITQRIKNPSPPVKTRTRERHLKAVG